MKRYWAFACYAFETGLGLDDLVGTYKTRKAAMNRAENKEWGAVFDSKTNKQMIHMHGNWSSPGKVRGFEEK